jgi:hypothetical protein
VGISTAKDHYSKLGPQRARCPLQREERRGENESKRKRIAPHYIYYLLLLELISLENISNRHLWWAGVKD